MIFDTLTYTLTAIGALLAIVILSIAAIDCSPKRKKK